MNAIPNFVVKVGGQKVQHTDTRVSDNIYKIAFDSSVRSAPAYVKMSGGKPQILSADFFKSHSNLYTPLPAVNSSNYKPSVQKNVLASYNDPENARLPAHMRVAKGYNGIKEIKGAGINPEIARWREHVMSVFPSLNIDELADDSSKCRLFILEALATTAELTGNKELYEPKVASNGDPIFGPEVDKSDLKIGDIVKMDLGGTEHWTFIEDIKGHKIKIFGGSQDEAVNGIWYDRASIQQVQRVGGTEAVDAENKDEDIDTTERPTKENATRNKKTETNKANSDDDILSFEANLDEHDPKVGDKGRRGGIITKVKTVRSEESVFSGGYDFEITEKMPDGSLQTYQRSKQYPCDCATVVKTDAVEGHIQADVKNSDVLEKMKQDGGRVTWQGFKDLMVEMGKFTTEAGVRLRLGDLKDGKFTFNGKEKISDAHGIGNPQNYSGMSVWTWPRMKKFCEEVQGLE
ncbi:MAG: hypothetical protein V4691_03570, partial [Pseudomonadota bacterium]